jgi:microsomal epoxide hydrolase
VKRGFIRSLTLFFWIAVLLVYAADFSLVLGASVAKSNFFETSDGVRLHYLEAGKGPETIVLIPGWLMPAMVFDAQLGALSERFRVIAFDPRSQGKSQVGIGAHTPERRSRDMHELLKVVKPVRPILAGWSLGVMEVLDYLAKYKSAEIAGLILIDNSIGEGAPPAASNSSRRTNPANRDEYLRNFTASLTKKPLSKSMFEVIYASARQVPPDIARELINKPFPREYWRDTLLEQRKPVLYAIRPRFEEQGRLLVSKRPGLAEVEVFQDAGHALFIDEAPRFNRVVTEFADRVWDLSAGRKR